MEEETGKTRKRTERKTEHLLHIATLLGAHGVRGQVRVRSLTEEPEALFTFTKVVDEQGRAFDLKRKGLGKDCFIVALKGVETRNEAEALRGVKLYVERKALPPLGKREYYAADLVGLEAREANGKKTGEVVALHDYGAGAFLEIKPAKGASFMLPFNDTFVPEVDAKNGRVKVVVPEGWIGTK